MVVQHNLQAMNANRMLGITTKQASGSTEKLSSGYRINRAADDAAGLAISEKMRKQIRGLTQASSNAEDGISCVQTAEGALAEVQEMLQRMNELAVQAANGTNSETDRQYIQDEFDQLIEEIDRVAETTKFNETYLLKGDSTKPTKNMYITNYSVTYTKNDKTNAASSNALEYKVNYKGTNNIYMVSTSVLSTNSNISVAAKKIGNGDDITDYMVTSDLENNDADAGLNSSKYVAMVNVELNSVVQSGKDGKVWGDLTTTTSVQRNAYDLSNNGNDDVVRANRDLYIYNTDNSTVTRITAGTDMSDYLNDDHTMKDKYRLVDILDGGEGTQYRGSTETSYMVKNGKLTEIKFNDTVTEAEKSNTVYAKSTKGVADYITVTTTTAVGKQSRCDIKKEFYVMSSTTGTMYAVNAPITSTSINATAKVTQVANTGGTPGTLNKSYDDLIQDIQSGKLVIYDKLGSDIYSEIGTSQRVKEQILGKKDFVWTNEYVEYDYSMQKLYDANGQEVSGVALNKYIDENGNYKGGLYTTSQARAIDEVFNKTVTMNRLVNGVMTQFTAATIGAYITQSSTQVAASLGVELHAGSDSDRNNKISIDLSTLTAAGLGIDKLASYNIGIVDSTGNNATDAIDVIADALNMVSRQRSALGAVQNRLEHTIKNLDNVVENTTSAESAIRDTDMAEEMVKYSNSNILQQAGQSMLAQANQANQGVLSLLQ